MNEVSTLSLMGESMRLVFPWEHLKPKNTSVIITALQFSTNIQNKNILPMPQQILF